MINQKIITKLENEINAFYQELKPHIKNEQLLERILNEFNKFDFDRYKKQLAKEIKDNLENWWTNPEKGINPEEKLLMIFFEYDSTWWENREALAYGVLKWDDFEIYREDFDMGYEYSFATEFYACPGLKLGYFNCFSFLDDDSDLEEKDKEGKYFDLDGFYELKEYISLTGILEISRVFVKLKEENLFEKINKNSPFLFSIGEHDMGQNPILTIG